MSGPFIYTPHPSLGTSNYVMHNYQPPQNSPFIPNSALYPSSPYSNPTSLSGSPQIPAVSLAPPGSPNTVAFPFETAWDQGGYAASIRQRRPSYHGDFVPPSSPFLQDRYPFESDPYSRARRRSFGGGPSILGGMQFGSASSNCYPRSKRRVTSPIP